MPSGTYARSPTTTDVRLTKIDFLLRIPTRRPGQRTPSTTPCTALRATPPRASDMRRGISGDKAGTHLLCRELNLVEMLPDVAFAEAIDDRGEMDVV